MFISEYIYKHSCVFPGDSWPMHILAARVHSMSTVRRIYADSYYNYNYSDFRKSTPEISGVEYMESTLAWLHHCSAFLPHFDIYNWLFFRNIEDILKEKQEIVKKVLDDESVEIVTKQILKDNNENT